MVRKNNFASVIPPDVNKIRDESYQLWSDEVQRARRKKSTEVDLRHSYVKRLEIGFIMTLVLLIFAFQLASRFEIKPNKISDVNLVIEAEDIPATEQFRKPPPPRPSLPVPSESEDVSKNLTIEFVRSTLFVIFDFSNM